jgi:hypothetical protein
MALQSIPGGVWIPEGFTVGVTPALVATGNLNAAAHKTAMVVTIPKAGAVRKVIWRTATVSTGATVDVRLETLDAAGLPSGTLWGASTNGAQVVLAADDNTTFATALTADATVARGDVLVVVIANNAGAPGNFFVAAASINSSIAGAAAERHAFQYQFTTAWAVDGGIGTCVALEYSDGSFAPLVGARPPGLVTATSLSTSTSPDVFGLRFRLPVAASVGGAWVAIDVDGPCDVRLVSTAYNQAAATGILTSLTVTRARSATTGGAYRVVFPSAVTLTANTDYRLVVEPTTTTAIAAYDTTMQSLAQLDAWPGGRDWHLTTAKDPTSDASWTNYNSGTFRRPFMGLLLEGLDDGAGVGGGEHAHAFIGGLA